MHILLIYPLGWFLQEFIYWIIHLMVYRLLHSRWVMRSSFNSWDISRLLMLLIKQQDRNMVTYDSFSLNTFYIREQQVLWTLRLTISHVCWLPYKMDYYVENSMCKVLFIWVHILLHFFNFVNQFILFIRLYM